MWRDGQSGEAGQAFASGGDKADVHQIPLSVEQLLWAVGSLCALHRLPFDQALLLKALPPPGTVGTLIHALRAVGLRATWEPMPLEQALQTGGVPTLALTIGPHVPLVLLAPAPAGGDAALITVFEAGSNIPLRESCEDFAQRYAGDVAARVHLVDAALAAPRSGQATAVDRPEPVRSASRVAAVCRRSCSRSPSRPAALHARRQAEASAW